MPPPMRLRAQLSEVGGMRGFDDSGELVQTPGRTPANLCAGYPDIALIVDELPVEGWWSGSSPENNDEEGFANFRRRVERLAEWVRALQPTDGDGRDIVIVG